MDFGICFRKGEVGGDRGFDAADSCFCCANDEGLSEGDDKRKVRKPKANSPARMSVIGFVRRNDRDMDIVEDAQSAADSLGGLSRQCVLTGILRRRSGGEDDVKMIAHTGMPQPEDDQSHACRSQSVAIDKAR